MSGDALLWALLVGAGVPASTWVLARIVFRAYFEEKWKYMRKHGLLNRPDIDEAIPDAERRKKPRD